MIKEINAGHSPGQEVPLEEGMAICASILAWRIRGQRSMVGYSPQGCKKLNIMEATSHTQRNKRSYNNSVSSNKK